MKVTSDRATLRQLYEWSRGQRVRIVLLVVLNALWAACIVGKALLAKNLIDSAVDHQWDGLVRYAVGLGVLILGQIASSLLVASLSEYVTSRLRISLQNHMLRQLMDTRYSAFRDYHSGELQNRMFSDVDVVTTGIVDLLPNGSFLLFKLVGATVSLSILAPKFTLIFLAAGILMFVLLTVLRKKMKHLHKEMQAAEGRVRSFFQEVLAGMLVVKVFGAEDNVADVAGAKQENYFRARMKRRTVTIASNAGFRFIFLAGYFIAMVWGVLGIYGGTVTFGTLTAMLQLVNQIQSPFTGFSGLIARYYSVLASAERLMEVGDLPKEEDRLAEADGSETGLAKTPLLSFDHVSFTYGRLPVLEDVSFEVFPGDFISLEGISGGGKSTLFLLLLDAYAPTTGQVRVRPSDSPGAGLFAYVPQGNALFSGTIRENVAFFGGASEGAPEPSDAALWQALGTACAADFVRALPKGLDTELSESGHGLSEGQMQRIAIARAIYSGAPVLLLDEATSPLDEQTEATLLHNLSALQDRTLFIVTHRPAAKAICNRHFCLENGQLIEN